MPHKLERALSALNRRPGLCLSILALLLALQISPYWYPTPDASGYLSIARSIASGKGPSNLGSRQLYLAPGYPVLISPVFLLGDQPFVFLSVAQWGLAIVFMLGVYTWMRRQVPAAAVLLTALVMVNVELWTLYRRTLSEMAFMATMIWVVNLLNHVNWAETSRPPLRGLVKLFAGSAILVLLVMIRQAGIMVAAGFAVVQLLVIWKGRRARCERPEQSLNLHPSPLAPLPGRLWSAAVTLAVGLPACLAIAGLIRYERAMAQASGSPTYLDHLIDPEATVAGQVLEGVRLRVSEVGRLTIPGMFKAYGRRSEWLNMNMAIYVPFTALVLYGWWRLVRKRPDVLLLTMPFYVGLYVIWPFDQATRFLVPMVPVLGACVWQVAKPLRQYRLQGLGILVLAHLGVAVGYWLGVEVPRARQNHVQWPDIEQLAAPMRLHDGGIVAMNIPENALDMFQLVLDRRVLDHPTDAPVGKNVRWIIMPRNDPVGKGYAVHAVAGDFQLVGPEGCEPCGQARMAIKCPLNGN
jgi:hypothetical protein